MSGLKKMIHTYLYGKKPRNPLENDLTNKVVVITGGSKGIGRAIAEVLAGENAKLALISRKQPAEMDHNDNIISLLGDVTSEKDVERMTKTVIDRFGRIDVLVNNAGLFAGKSIEESTLVEFDSIVSTNMRGIYLMSRAVIPAMKRQKQGFIINIGSKISHNTNVTPRKVLYAMTKYAVEGFSFALNKELKPFGVRISCLMPGTVNTFLSLKSHEYLSPYDIGYIVNMMIKYETIDFEGLIIKSVNQNI